ncbi:hypothetical protein FB45DRAFT_1062509 [Roridomyces roridus]|uniref:Uncharacterized protein n=1 Tax=Roridomyces roridus TaxID=1738132 RepID=A0AAD7FHD5_9AGAR|nr:hypothetical protein FB45DRAFT_1062509 [Roridomyces roridus]
MLSISITGGSGGAGGPSPKDGGQGGRGGGPQVDSEAAKLTQKLSLVGGNGGAGGQGGNRGGDGGFGETADMLLPLLTAEEIKLLPRMGIQEFCEKYELEDVYPKLHAQSYKKVTAVAATSPQKLKDVCGLKEGDIYELKTAMQELIDGKTAQIIQANVSVALA